MNSNADGARPRLVTLEADSATDLAGAARALAGRCAAGEVDLTALDQSLPSRSRPRLAIASASPEQAADQLRRAANHLETGGGARLLPGRGIFVGAPEDNLGRLAMLFPGQGAQAVGMFHELAQSFEVVRQTFDEADDVLSDLLERRLTSVIWAEEEGGEAASTALTATTYTQPALLACELAMLRLLRELGVEPELVAGHSLGEYTACVAAGVMSPADALRAVAVRGKAMTEATPPGVDPGAMAAVAAPLSELEPLLTEVEGYVIPANKNCDAQTIIAGATEAVEAAVTRCDEAGLRTALLPVSHAFHTAIVEPAGQPLERFLSGLELRPPRLPVLSNVTGREYPDGAEAPAEVVRLLTTQVASPVEFIAEIERMWELGGRFFLEVGPRETLTAFVDKILAGRPHRARPTNGRRKGDVRGLAEALAALVAAGFEVDLERWHAYG